MQLTSDYSLTAPLPFQLQRRATVTASTEPIPVWLGQSGRLTVVMTPSADCYVRFGQYNVSAATSDDFPLLAGKIYAFQCNLAQTHFAVIRRAADGVLSFYVPGSPAAPGLPPLPTLAVEYWHAQQQLTSASWQGQLGARALAGLNTPVVAVDGSFFRGAPVAQADIAGTKAWKGSGLTQLAAIGSRPYTASVFRFRAPLAVDGTAAVIDMGVNILTDNHYVHEQRTGGVSVLRGYVNGASAIATATAADALPHFVEFFLDGTNLNIVVDGTAYTTASAATMTANITAVGLGVAASGPYHWSDSSHAFHLVCSAPPTPGERSTLRDWARSYWGTP